MEQKNMEKIDKLYDLVVEKNNALIERHDAIKKSLFTPDMEKIMQTLYEHYVKRIEFKEDHVNLQFVDTRTYSTPTFTLQYFESNSGSPLMLCPWTMNRKEYSDSMIGTLERYIKKAKEIDQRLTFIEDHMEEFVRKISEYYK